MLFYLAIIAALLWEWARRSEPLRDDEPRFGADGSIRAVALLSGLLVGSFVLELGIVAFDAAVDGTSARALGFPLAIVEARHAPIDLRRELVSLAMFVVVTSQAALLFALHRALVRFGRHVPRAPIVAGALAMWLLATFAPALTSGDAYAYVGDALLGSAAYHPPHHPFAGQYAAISSWWRTPMEPSPYGPLWLRYNEALLALAPTLFTKLLVLRLAGTAWLLVILWCAAARRVHPATLSLLALNPALFLQFVANAHNDVIAIALLMLALVAARGGWALQLPFVIAAGLVKLPFAAIALATLAGRVRSRIVAAVLCLAATAALSLLFGGRSYAGALFSHVEHHSDLLVWTHGVVALAALAAVAVALVANRRSSVAAFTFPSLAAVIYPWYAPWGLPYAAQARSLAWFLTALPVASLLFESSFDVRIPLGLVTTSLLVLAVREVLVERRRPLRRVPSFVVEG